MSLISRTIRTEGCLSNQRVQELDIARHLWNRDDDVDLEIDSEAAFSSSLTNDRCGVLHLPYGSLPQRIIYRLVNDSRSFALEPIALNNNFNVSLQSLKINLPDQIISNCFVINSFVKDDGTYYIVIDALSESGSLFTIGFAVTEFLEGSFSLSSDAYDEWCHITNAYGFDVRKPHLLYSYSPDYTVVLLKDGGIIGLQKSQKNFSIDPVLFNDNSYFESLGSFLTPWTNKSKLSVPQGLSEKTVIDCTHYEDLLITITINKKLRLWSKSKRILLLEKNLSEVVSGQTSNKDLFDSQPTKLLDILETAEHGTFLSLFLPFGNGVFKIFKLQSSPLDILDLGSNFEFNSKLPESTSIWLVGDFKLISKGKTLQLWVLWKSGSSSMVQSSTIQEDGRSEWNTTSQNESNSLVLTKLSNEDWSQFYNRKLFQCYSNKILLTSLSIFQKHFLPDETNVDGDLSIVDRLNKLVGANITFDKNYERTIERQWFRFDSLCQEFQKQANEPLKLYIGDGFVLLVNKEGFSTIRQYTELEIISANKSLRETEEIRELSKAESKLRFLNVISNFKKSLGKEIQENLLNSIILNLNNTQRPVKDISIEIYEQTLNKKINPKNLTNFVQQLSELDGLLQIIAQLLEATQNGSIDKSEAPPIIDSKLSEVGSLLVTSSTKQTMDTNFEILFDLFILLLVLEFEDKDSVNSYLNTIFKLCKSYYIFNTVYEIRLKRDLSVEIDEVSKVSLAGYVLNSEVPKGFQFTDDSLVSVIEKNIKFINSKEFLYRAIIFLVGRGFSKLAYYKFLPFLDDLLPISNILKPVIYFKIGEPEKAAKYFILNESRISNFKLSQEEKQLLEPIADFTVFFNTKLSKYYLNLAILFLNNYYFKEASEFINLSIIKKNFVNDKFDDEYNEQKYHALFTISLELQDFHNVKFAINNITSPDLKKESLKRLVSTLFKTKSIHKLLEFEFLKDEKLIDALLYERAGNPKNTFNKALTYYKVLYSFRFKNKNNRGSLESLYEFIFRFKPTADYRQLSTISDLYAIIINLLKSFKPDDQWIIYHVDKEEDDVLSIEDLKNEQLALAKEIKSLQN